MFEAIEIWSRTDHREIIRYTCLKDIKTKLFAVHSADFFHAGGKPSEDQKQHVANFIEMLLETDPRERCDWFETPHEAIAQHISEYTAD